MRNQVLQAARRSNRSRVWLCQSASTMRDVLADAQRATSGWNLWDKPRIALAVFVLGRVREWLCEDVQIPRKGP